MKYSDKRPLALKAANQVVKAVRTGVLPNLKKKKVKCVDCGKRATEYDHRDYSKPLDVSPVCRGCNIRRGPAKPYLVDTDGFISLKKISSSKRTLLAREAMLKAAGLKPGARSMAWEVSLKLSPHFINSKGNPLTPEAIRNWWEIGVVPTRHVPKLAELAGLDLSDIDPMVFPP